MGSKIKEGKIMKYDVVSVSLTPDGRYGLKAGKLLVRTERINTSTNAIFMKIKTQEDVERRYEAYWRLDNHWKYGQCKVLAVIPVNREKEID
jgi:hypothetical protein